MKPFLLLLTLTMVLSNRFSLQAQNAAGRIGGTIANIKNVPLAGASVTLLQAADSTTHKTIAAGEDGYFVFKKLREGRYVLVITSVGYKKYISHTFTIDASHTNLLLPAIVLETATQNTLKEVVVAVKKPLTEQRIDRTIVNVDAMITAAGSNALEVLGRSPGVNVQSDGDISLYGKGGVLVLIDDKPTYLSVPELAAYLRSLPAGLIDKIELISHPPARYDASGSAIINIQLKKNRAPGFNGNVLVGYSQGVYRRNNEAIIINYRKKRINVFANGSHATDGNYNRETARRSYYNTDGSLSQSLLINKRYTYQSDGINIRTGLDYFISAKTTAGIMLTGGIRPRSDRLGYHSDQWGSGGKPDSTANGAMHGDYQWYSGGINLNAQHKFNDNGTTLSSDLDLVALHAGGNQYLSTQVYGPDGAGNSSMDIKYDLPADINIWSAKADYIQPMKDKMQLEVGLKSSYVRTKYNNDWYDGVGDLYTPDYSKTNHFIYGENINAAYVSITKKWKRWSAKAGVRVENTNMHGHQLPNIAIPDSSFSRSYTNAFPDCYLQYKLDSSGNHTLTFSYNKRIRRPNYQQLNPFLFYNDRYSYTAGNPGLKPHYLNGIELRYNYKSNFGIVFGYTYINNLIQSLIEPAGETLITRPRNFGSNYAFNCSPFVSFSPVKGWNMNTTLVLFHLVNKGVANNQVIQGDITSAELEMNNQFRFSKSWSAELAVFYASPHLGGQTRTNTIWRMDAGVQKTVLKDKGTVRVNMTDIFHSMIRRDQFIGIPLMQSNRRLENDTRRIGLSFSYRFGATINNRRRNQHSGSATEEQGRLN